MLVLSGCSLEGRIYPLMELLGGEINLYNNILYHLCQHILIYEQSLEYE